LQKDSGVYIDPEDSAERLKMDISELARSINVSVTTANRYLDLMVDLHWLD
jgi:response regulator of citrate/malate metabolism